MDNNYEIVRRMITATSQIDGVYYLFSRWLGINENTLAFFYTINDGKPHSQKEICNEMLIPRTTINTIVKNVLAEGYIEFVPQRHFKEKYIVLTEKGKEYANNLLSKLYKAEEAAMTSTLESFSPKFIEAVEHFSKAFSEEFNKIKEKSDGQL